MSKTISSQTWNIRRGEALLNNSFLRIMCMQFNKGDITISHIIIFSKTFNQSTSAASLHGRCSTNLGTKYIRVFAVMVGVSTTVIDDPKGLHCLSSNLVPRPSFQEEFLDKGAARRVVKTPLATWVHVVSYKESCLGASKLTWEWKIIQNKWNIFLVCKLARGHFSSETQGKTIEDESYTGKLVAVRVRSPPADHLYSYQASSEICPYWVKSILGRSAILEQFWDWGSR